MSNRRQQKIAELLHQEISQIIQFETEDPRLGFVTVTGVDVSPDLGQARVYVSILGDKTEIKKTLAGLASAAGYFRHQLAQSVSLRHIPELTFKLDNSLEHGLRIEKLLDTIQDESDTTESPAENELED